MVLPSLCYKYLFHLCHFQCRDDHLRGLNSQLAVKFEEFRGLKGIADVMKRILCRGLLLIITIEKCLIKFLLLALAELIQNWFIHSFKVKQFLIFFLPLKQKKKKFKFKYFNFF